MNRQKGFTPLIIIVIATVIIGAGIGGFLVFRDKKTPSPQEVSPQASGEAIEPREESGVTTTVSERVMQEETDGRQTPRFSFIASPSTQNIAAGGAASYEAQVTFLNDFNSTAVDLWVTGVPAGMTARYAPDPLPHQGVSVLTIRGDGTEKLGTSTLTLGATAEGITHTQQVTLIISTTPDFTMGISPATQAVAAGKTAAYEISLAPVNGFTDAVTLSVSGVPGGVSSSFSSNPARPWATALLTLAASAAAPQGAHEFLITGVSAAMLHTVPATLHVTAPGSAWTISSIGKTGDKNNTVRVGPARNDGVERVYVGTVETGRVIEFSWEGTYWGNPIDIGGSPAGEEIHNMTIGPGRNDGILRLYAGSLDDNLYELTYNNSHWTQATVGVSAGDVFHAAVGNGRNDGMNRLYATRGTQVWEYTWTGSDWSTVFVGEVSSGVAHGIALGDGRGDGTNQLYVASTGSGVYEGIFAGGRWSLARMGDSGDVRNVEIGVGRNDGVRRVYAALLTGGRVREFTWNGRNWTVTQLTGYVGAKLVHAYVFAGREDGVQRVYASGSNGNAYEFSWDGSRWTTYTLGGGAGYMYGFHFGRGRNDGVVRLYGGSFNTRVYEYTWSAP